MVMIPWARDEAGEVIHVDEALRGLASRCTCLECNSPLIARKGEQNAYHFAHYASGCNITEETALHKAAKEIVARATVILLPSMPGRWITRTYFSIEAGFFRKKIWVPCEYLSITSGEVEYRSLGVVVDVKLTIDSRPIFIEIVVTHGIDGEKLSKLESLGVSCLAIDLSKLPRAINKNDLSQVLIHGAEFKQWVFRPQL